MLEKVKETTSFIQSKIKLQPEIGIILGTGLGGMIREIKDQQIIEYQSIPNFPVSTDRKSVV